MATATSQSSNTRQQLWRNLAMAHGRVHTALETALSEAGLPPLAWFDVLHPITISEEKMLRPRDLGCGVQISRSGLTRLLDRMESGEVITRRHCDEDRRGSYVRLTDTGADTAAAMSKVIEAELEKIFGDLYDEDEALQLTRLLAQAAAN